MTTGPGSHNNRQSREGPQGAEGIRLCTGASETSCNPVPVAHLLRTDKVRCMLLGSCTERCQVLTSARWICQHKLGQCVWDVAHVTVRCTSRYQHTLSLGPCR